MNPCHRVSPSKCPQCGQELSAASMLDGADPPRPGCLTVCIRCAGVLILGEDLRARPLTDQEAAEIAADSETLADLAKTVTAIRMWRASGN